MYKTVKNNLDLNSNAIVLPRVRIPIRVKIVIPYLLLSIFLALGAACVITQIVFDSLEERFTNQLIESGKPSSEWMVREEERLIKTMRLVSNSTGVSKAIQARQVERLRDLTFGIVISNQEDHPVEPAAHAGFEYHGTSLGLPAWVEKLTWKWFIKSCVADGERVRGWNIRVDQDAPWTPRMRRGTQVTFGHFSAVREGDTTVLDYGHGSNRRGDPIAMLRDPLVALEPGSADRLLGVSLIDAAGVRLPTPAYFLLERGGPVRSVVAPKRARAYAVTTASSRSAST